MHFLFIPYGMKKYVDRLLMEMECQKHLIKFTKEGEPDLSLYIDSQIRVLPFGVIDYVFPKEDLDIVLTSLLEANFKLDDPVYDGIGDLRLPKIASMLGIDDVTDVFRKVLNAEKIPEFKRENRFLWPKEHTAIIPIGIKYDGEITEPANSPHPGYKHERI